MIWNDVDVSAVTPYDRKLHKIWRNGIVAHIKNSAAAEEGESNVEQVERAWGALGAARAAIGNATPVAIEALFAATEVYNAALRTLEDTLIAVLQNSAEDKGAAKALSNLVKGERLTYNVLHAKARLNPVLLPTPYPSAIFSPITRYRCVRGEEELAATLPRTRLAVSACSRPALALDAAAPPAHYSIRPFSPPSLPPSPTSPSLSLPFFLPPSLLHCAIVTVHLP